MNRSRRVRRVTWGCSIRLSRASVVRFVAAFSVCGFVLFLPVGAISAPYGTIVSGASAPDPAVGYYNPAGLAQLSGTHVMLSSPLSFVGVSYERSGSTAFPRADLSVVVPAPVAAVSTDFGTEDWRFAVLYSLPVFEGSEWDATTAGVPSSTRYHVLEARYVQFNIQPTVAYRITEKISVGLGLDVSGLFVLHAAKVDFAARLNQEACFSGGACTVDAPFPRENAAFDGELRAQGLGWGVGFALGVLYEPIPKLVLGFGVHTGSVSPIEVPIDVEITIPSQLRQFSQINFPALVLPEFAASGAVGLRAPMSIHFGARYSLEDKHDFMFDTQWINKSSLALMRVEVLRASSTLLTDQVLVTGQRDALYFALTYAYQWLPELRVASRIDFEPNTRPEELTTPLTLDLSRIGVHLGVLWRATDWASVIFEYGHIFFVPRFVTRSNYSPNAQPTTVVEQSFDKPSPTGRYSAHQDRFALTLQLHW